LVGDPVTLVGNPAKVSFVSGDPTFLGGWFSLLGV